MRTGMSRIDWEPKARPRIEGERSGESTGRRADAAVVDACGCGLQGSTGVQQIAREPGVSGSERARQVEDSRRREQMRRAGSVVSSANSNARGSPYDEGNLKWWRFRL